MNHPAKRSVYFFPFNGNTVEALDCLTDLFHFKGFIDDNPDLQGKEKIGYKIFSRDILINDADAGILAVPGNSENYRNRKFIIDSLTTDTSRFVSMIHPKAVVSSLASIGHNVLILAGTVITSNARIGNNVCILANSTIHHDSHIENESIIGSNVCIAGHSRIGKNCYIASGTNIINNIEIGDFTLTGMGSNVIKSLPANVKAVGNPAKII